jgi:hypothetical protein
MFLNSSSPMGMSLAILNIFLVPPFQIPVPLPNIAKPMMGTGFSTKVLLGFMPSHTRNTSIPLTLGDTAGFAFGGGVASKMAMGEHKHILSSFTVLVENKPVTRSFIDITTQNKNNGIGFPIVPSQFAVLALA